MSSLVFQRWVILLFLMNVGFAQESASECPDAAGQAWLGPNLAPIPFQVPEPLSYLPRPSSRKVELAVEYGEDGTIRCISPISGLSLYWPIAEEIAKRRGRNGNSAHARQILRFEANRVRPDLSKPIIPCDRHASMLGLLKAGADALARDRDDEARNCYSIATNIDPQSFIARYGAARLAGFAGATQSRIGHLEAVAAINPTFFEARVELAYALVDANQSDQAIESINALLNARPPLPTRCAGLEALVYAFERHGTSADILRARRSELGCNTVIHQIDVSAATSSNLAILAQELAIEEEQAGYYGEAATHFAEAAKWSASSAGAKDAYGFDAAMGQARCLRATGTTTEPDRLCETWSQTLRRLGTTLNGFEWGGADVAKAKWQFSCGSRERALNLLKGATAMHPDSDAPYRALELFLRAEGKGALADEAHKAAEQVRVAHDNRILQSIFDDAYQSIRK